MSEDERLKKLLSKRFPLVTWDADEESIDALTKGEFPDVVLSIGLEDRQVDQFDSGLTEKYSADSELITLCERAFLGYAESLEKTAGVIRTMLRVEVADA